MIGRDRLRFAVAIGMGLVRRPGGKLQPAPDDGRTRDVERGFDSVRDQDIGMPERAGDDLGRRQNDIGSHPDQGDAGAGLRDCRPECSRVGCMRHRMSGSIKAIVYQAHGKPEEVLRLEEQTLPALGGR